MVRVACALTESRQVLLLDGWRLHRAAGRAATTSAAVADIHAVYTFTQVDPLGGVVVTAAESTHAPLCTLG